MIADFVNRWGVLALVCGGLVGLIGFLDRFETVAASEQKWQAHNQAMICQTVAELRREIRALEVKAEFTEPEKQMFLLAQIEQIRTEIARIDPDGVC